MPGYACFRNKVVEFQEAIFAWLLGTREKYKKLLAYTIVRAHGPIFLAEKQLSEKKMRISPSSPAIWLRQFIIIEFFAK